MLMVKHTNVIPIPSAVGSWLLVNCTFCDRCEFHKTGVITLYTPTNCNVNVFCCLIGTRDILTLKFHVSCHTLGYSTPAPTWAPISGDDNCSSNNQRWLDATCKNVVKVVAALVESGRLTLSKWWMPHRDSSSSCWTRMRAKWILLEGRLRFTISGEGLEYESERS